MLVILTGSTSSYKMVNPKYNSSYVSLLNDTVHLLKSIRNIGYHNVMNVKLLFSQNSVLILITAEHPQFFFLCTERPLQI